MKSITLTAEDAFEILAHLPLKDNDVLELERDKARRHRQLMKAVSLDSVQPQVVILVVEDQISTKKVLTRVFAAGNDKVLIEHGISLPTQCIQEVQFPA